MPNLASFRRSKVLDLIEFADADGTSCNCLRLQSCRTPPACREIG
jgi:hypothetical protein